MSKIENQGVPERIGSTVHACCIGKDFKKMFIQAVRSLEIVKYFGSFLLWISCMQTDTFGYKTGIHVILN
jgi:hypothetical protein